MPWNRCPLRHNLPCSVHLFSPTINARLKKPSLQCSHPLRRKAVSSHVTSYLLQPSSPLFSWSFSFCCLFCTLASALSRAFRVPFVWMRQRASVLEIRRTSNQDIISCANTWRLFEILKSFKSCPCYDLVSLPHIRSVESRIVWLDTLSYCLRYAAYSSIFLVYTSVASQWLRHLAILLVLSSNLSWNFLAISLNHRVLEETFKIKEGNGCHKKVGRTQEHMFQVFAFIASGSRVLTRLPKPSTEDWQSFLFRTPPSLNLKLK